MGAHIVIIPMEEATKLSTEELKTRLMFSGMDIEKDYRGRQTGSDMVFFGTKIDRRRKPWRSMYQKEIAKSETPAT